MNMNYYKHLFTLLLTLIVTVTSFGQNHLLLSSGQNMTNFLFKDDQGTKDTSYNANFSSSFNLGYAFSLEQGVYFSTKLGLRRAGASYVYDDFNYNWNIMYSEYRLGVGYMYGFGKLNVHLSTEGYVAYALTANQRLFDVNRDMIAAGTIERLDYGLFASPGVGYNITESVTAELDLNYMYGLGNLETNTTQTSQNTLYGLSVGLNIKL